VKAGISRARQQGRPTALHNFDYGSLPAFWRFFRSASRTLWTEV
jgi:hypothetical protein